MMGEFLSPLRGFYVRERCTQGLRPGLHSFAPTELIAVSYVLGRSPDAAVQDPTGLIAVSYVLGRSADAAVQDPVPRSRREGFGHLEKPQNYG